jgi:3D-(3,5/4)-trihydroxycyclohexane-1,2-dione acylhydrolase (decyclizing)
VALARAVKGVEGIFGGYDAPSLAAAVEQAYAHDGLAVVHVPVYWGDDTRGGMGVYGRWNVGNWSEDVQRRYRSQPL